MSPKLEPAYSPLDAHDEDSRTTSILESLFLGAPIGNIAVFSLIANIFLLCALTGSFWAYRPPLTELERIALQAPWSPAQEAVVPVIKRFNRPEVYLKTNTPEVEARWKALLGSHDGIVRIEASVAAKLPHESVSWETGYTAYGLAMFHQLHCLNRIRKSYYPDVFYPTESPEHIELHKDHCIELLLQAIQCAGDVSLIYWWNSTFTRTVGGREEYTEEYLQMTPEEKSKNARVFWEVDHQCRDFDRIAEWAEQHRAR